MQWHQFAIGTMHAAIRAKRLLQSAQVDAEVIKLDARNSTNGCQYGIRFAEAKLLDAAKILRENDVLYTTYRSD